MQALAEPRQTRSPRFVFLHHNMEKLRIDKWLWAARFFKTRSLATEAVNGGQVMINAAAAKASREVRVGDRLDIRLGAMTHSVAVLGISAARGPAPVARLLYQESTESEQKRAEIAQRLRFNPDPAQTLAHGRPTKRDRRALEKDWDTRWSASIDH